MKQQGRQTLKAETAGESKAWHAWNSSTNFWCAKPRHTMLFMLLYLWTDTLLLQKKSMGSKIKNRIWNNVYKKTETWNRRDLWIDIYLNALAHGPNLAPYQRNVLQSSCTVVIRAVTLNKAVLCNSVLWKVTLGHWWQMCLCFNYHQEIKLVSTRFLTSFTGCKPVIISIWNSNGLVKY